MSTRKYPNGSDDDVEHDILAYADFERHMLGQCDGPGKCEFCDRVCWNCDEIKPDKEKPCPFCSDDPTENVLAKQLQSRMPAILK